MNLSTALPAQHQRIISWLLEHKSLTTIEARNFLEIFHPASRIKELIDRGFEIITERVTIDGHIGVAKYILLSIPPDYNPPTME